MSETAHERLLQLAEKFDGLTPEVVVVDAIRKDSPLHKHFCWDNDEAAHRYRLEQARALIRHFKITIDRPGRDEPITVRSFQFITSQDRYQRTEAVLQNEAWKDEVLARAAAELRSFRKKYQNLVDVEDLVRDVFDLTIHHES